MLKITNKRTPWTLSAQVPHSCVHALFVGPVQLEIWGAACSARHQHPQIGSGSKTSFPNLTNLLNWGHLRFRGGDFLLIPLLTFYGLQKAWNVTDVDSLDYFGLISGLRRCFWRRFLLDPGLFLLAFWIYNIYIQFVQHTWFYSTTFIWKPARSFLKTLPSTLEYF